MPDRTTRALLMKKALDRWENEGGTIFAGSARVDERRPAEVINSRRHATSRPTAAVCRGAPELSATYQ